MAGDAARGAGAAFKSGLTSDDGHNEPGEIQKAAEWTGEKIDELAKKSKTAANIINGTKTVVKGTLSVGWATIKTAAFGPGNFVGWLGTGSPKGYFQNLASDFVKDKTGFSTTFMRKGIAGDYAIPRAVFNTLKLATHRTWGG